jgi:phage tail-like protein
MPVIGASNVLGIGQSVTGLRDDPYLSCNFVIEIEGLLLGGFSECSGLQVESETFEYREGGVNDYVHRFVGPTKHPPLVLKRGLSLIDGLWGWHQDVVAGNITRRNGTIYLLSRPKLANGAVVPVRWWNFHAAVPVKWTGPDLQASASAIAFETVEIAHRGLSRPRLTTLSKDLASEWSVLQHSLDAPFF